MVCDHEKNLVRNLEGMLVCPECGEVLDEFYLSKDLGTRFKEGYETHTPTYNVGARTTFDTYNLYAKQKPMFNRLKRINDLKYNWEIRYTKLVKEISIYNINKGIKNGVNNLARKIVKSTNVRRIRSDWLVKTLFYYYMKINYNIPIREILKKIDICEEGPTRLLRNINYTLHAIKDAKYNGKNVIDMNKIKRESLESTTRYYCNLVGVKDKDLYEVIRDSKIIEPLARNRPKATYVAALIYQHYKENGRRVSLEYLSDVFNITTGSIRQRWYEVKMLKEAKRILATTDKSEEEKRRLISVLTRRILNMPKIGSMDDYNTLIKWWRKKIVKQPSRY